jgi:hypothetical protein
MVAEVSSATVSASLGKGRTQARVSSGSHPGGDAPSCITIASMVALSAATVAVVAGVSRTVDGGVVVATVASLVAGEVVAGELDGAVDGPSDELHPATHAVMSRAVIPDRTGAMGRDRTRGEEVTDE